MIKLKWLVVLTALMIGNLYAGGNEFTVSKMDYGPSVEFKTGAVGPIQIPLDVLSEAKVAAFDGLVFIFKDGSNFSMETMTDRQVGYVGVDMKTWPEYVLGFKTEGDEPKRYIEDLLNSKKFIIEEKINPYDIRIFKIDGGTGYWAVGTEKSVVIFTSDEISDQLTVFFTQGMSEGAIKKSIINGVVK